MQTVTERGGWSRAAVNFALDAVLLLLFVGLMGVTGIVAFVFPPAERAAGWRLWGLELTGWIRLQCVAVAILSLGVLVHIILHWTWACGFLTSRLTRWTGRAIKLNESERTLYGVGLLIFLLTAVGIVVGAGTLTIRAAP